MPPPLLPHRPALRVQGRDAPTLSQALVSVQLLRPARGAATLTLGLQVMGPADNGLWTALNVGDALGLDAEPGQPLFDGAVVAVGGQWPAGAAPRLQLVAGAARRAAPAVAPVVDLALGQALRSAELLADSRLAGAEARPRGQVVLASARPALLPGTRVRLLGLGTRFSGLHRVLSLRVAFDLDQGWSTTLDLQREAAG